MRAPTAGLAMPFARTVRLRLRTALRPQVRLTYYDAHHSVCIEEQYSRLQVSRTPPPAALPTARPPPLRLPTQRTAAAHV